MATDENFLAYSFRCQKLQQKLLLLDQSIQSSAGVHMKILQDAFAWYHGFRSKTGEEADETLTIEQEQELDDISLQNKKNTFIMAKKKELMQRGYTQVMLEFLVPVQRIIPMNTPTDTVSIFQLAFSLRQFIRRYEGTETTYEKQLCAQALRFAYKELTGFNYWAVLDEKHPEAMDLLLTEEGIKSMKEEMDMLLPSNQRVKFGNLKEDLEEGLYRPRIKKPTWGNGTDD